MSEENADAGNEDKGGAEDNGGVSLVNNQDAAPQPFDFSKGRPETFDEKYWDADKNAPNVDALYKNMTDAEKRAEGLRTKLAKGEKGGAAPEKLEDYAFTLDDKASAEDKEIFGKIPADDPLLKLAREGAKKAGMSVESFNEVFGPIAKAIAGAKDTVTTPPTEEEKKAYIAAEVAKLGKGGAAIVKGLGDWKTQQVASGLMSANDVKAFNEVTETAEGVAFLNRLIQRMGAPVVPHDVGVDDAAATADIEKKMSEAFKAGNEPEYNKWKAQLLQRKGA